ncbi:hypothetical protein N7488_000727 [Penicillium malachiteum]|nr:hypothetical protein N7488_000727 [Penicillium malachiteum]
MARFGLGTFIHRFAPNGAPVHLSVEMFRGHGPGVDSLISHSNIPAQVPPGPEHLHLPKMGAWAEYPGSLGAQSHQAHLWRKASSNVAPQINSTDRSRHTTEYPVLERSFPFKNVNFVEVKP